VQAIGEDANNAVGRDVSHVLVERSLKGELTLHLYLGSVYVGIGGVEAESGNPCYAFEGHVAGILPACGLSRQRAKFAVIVSFLGDTAG
jgi:hypothetical protein